jgi:cytoskeletal protein CcmA (bactofilin family)
MDDNQKNGGQSPQDSSSLETNDQSTYSPESLEGSGGLALTPEEQAQQQQQQKQSQRKQIFNVRLLLHRFNAYLVIFLFLIIIGVIIIVVAYFRTNGQNTNNSGNNTPSQNLSANSLEQLANNGTVIGGPKQTLNIESNAVFQNQVLVRGDLDVAGSVKLGGSLALQSLTVGGTTSLGQLNAQSLSITGNVGVQGQLSALSIGVAGGGSFGGPVTAPSLIANSLQLNGDLGITHHIDTGGGAPGLSRGGALGGGGTASVSGSDTAGSININTGSGASSGCFATLNFAHSFGSTPHVIVTPVGAAAAGIQYYVTRSTGSFSLCTASAAPSGTSFGFDYIIID